MSETEEGVEASGLVHGGKAQLFVQAGNAEGQTDWETENGAHDAGVRYF